MLQHLSSLAKSDLIFARFSERCEREDARREEMALPPFDSEAVRIGTLVAEAFLAPRSRTIESKVESLNHLALKLRLCASECGIDDALTSQMMAVAICRICIDKERFVTGFKKDLADASADGPVLPAVRAPATEIRRNIARYFIQYVDVPRCISVLDLERNTFGIRLRLADNGMLGIFGYRSSARSVVRMAYPEYLEEDSDKDYPVREWLLHGFGKLPERALAKKAFGWAIRLTKEVVPELPFDELLRHIPYRRLFDRVGVSRLVSAISKKSTGDTNLYAAVTLGVEWVREQESSLGRQALTLPPKWHIHGAVDWIAQDPLGNRAIDRVTVSVMKKLRDSNPAVFDRDGNIIPSVAKKLPWNKLYHGEHFNCLKESNLTVAQALARVMPELFGWERGKILAESLFMQGDQSFAQLKLLFVFSLWQEGLGRLSDDEKQIEIESKDFERWLSRTPINGHWKQFISDNSLDALVRRHARSNVARAVNMIFRGTDVFPEETNKLHKNSPLLPSIIIRTALKERPFTMEAVDSVKEFKPLVFSDDRFIDIVAPLVPCDDKKIFAALMKRVPSYHKGAVRYPAHLMAKLIERGSVLHTA